MRHLTIFLFAPCVSVVMAQPWTQLSPAGGPPAARFGHTAILNTSSRTMVLFGGSNAISKFNDTWRLSNADGQGAPVWTQVTTINPTPQARSSHTAVYDVIGDNMFVFGGVNSVPACLNDIFVLTGASGGSNWLSPAISGTPPSPRNGHSAVIDAVNRRMIVYGGACGAVVPGNVYILSNLGTIPTWSQAAVSGGPPPARFVHAAIYDPNANRMIIFGGQSSSGSDLNDVWALSNANGIGGTSVWTQLFPTGPAPSPREGVSAIYDPAADRMTIFGGFSGSNEVWVLRNTRSNPSWANITPTGTAPSARSWYSLVYTPSSDRMTLFGGFGPPMNDVWVLRNPTGVDTTITSNPGGLDVTVDSITATAPQTYNWGEGTSHTVSTASSLGSPTRYIFSNWSDGGLQSHTVLGPASITTLTANFITQHLLTRFIAPTQGGLLNASPSSSDGFYNSGTSVQLTAVPNAGYALANFSGDLTGSVNPQSIVMSTPRSVTANFSCAYSLSASGASFSSTGGGGSVNVTAGGTCSWTVTGVPSWIIITSGASGTGNGTVNYSVMANPGGSPRSATLTIGGQPYTVNQSGLGCNYSLSSPGASFEAAGGAGSVNVIANSGCPWSATGQPSWVTIASGSSGSGNGTVNFSVAANASGSARSAMLTIAGTPFSIIQAGLGCVFGFTPLGVSLQATGGAGVVNVSSSATDCPRMAVSNAPWITVTSGASGTGAGSVGYTVDVNTGSISRNGSITISGQTFTVSQSGMAPCTYSLPQSTQSFSAGAGTGSASISTQAGCAWTASGNAAFITITTGSGMGPGAFAFSLAANPNADGRTGTITTTGGLFTIQQAGLTPAISCSVLNGPAPAVRAEGRTELTRDIVMTCSGTAPAGGFTGDLTLRLNTPITSRKLDAAADATEALLLTGDPVPPSPQIGANAFLGQVAGYNLLRWPGLLLLPAGTNVSQTFRIMNVRADASGLGLPAGAALPVTATLSIAARAAVPIANATQTVAASAAGAVFSRGSATQNSGTQYTIPLSFRETTGGVFKLRGGESGYTNAALLGSAVGSANTATRVRIRVTSIPAGGQLSVSLASVDGKAVLVTGADENGAGGTIGFGGVGFAPLTIANGVGTASWEIVTADPAAIETLTFQLLAETANLADLANVQVSGSLGPVSAVGVASATAPVPRFRDFSVPEKLVKLRARTTLDSSTKPTPLRAATSGGNVTFVNQIVNDSDIAAPNVVIHDSLPSTLALLSCSAPGAVCSATGSGVTAQYPSLLPGESVTVTITAQVVPTTPAGTVIENTVSASSDILGPDLNASTASVSFAVTGGCSYALGRVTASVGAAGDQGKVDVITAPGCPWTAMSNDGWIALPPTGVQNVGPGTQRYTVASNPAATPRTAILVVADQAFQVTQAAAGCSFTVSASSSQIPPAGGGFTLNVIATPANCAWTASAAPGWITLPAGASSTGSGSVPFAVAANSGTNPRTGTITVAGTAIQILQQRSNTPPPVAQFTDVPVTHPYFDYITLLRAAAVTGGCTPNQYCPDATTTRGQMAVFIIRSLYGGDEFPSPTQPFFTDVPATHPYFKYIQKMRDLGITSGCTAALYCPDDAVTRGQMAVFLIRARLGIAAGAAFPFPPAPFFTDVPAIHDYFSFIQKMRELGITSGCTAAVYCANDLTTRGQMAVFLIRAFFTP